MIECDVDGDGIGRLVLARPEARNAISIKMWEQLGAALDALRTSPSLRLIIVSSSVEGIFCPGADIKEFEALTKDASLRRRMRLAMQSAISKLEAAPRPTIAAIEGPCIGSGCAIALACDLRVAGQSAKFGVTPAKLGLIFSKDDVRRLAAAVGDAIAKDLLFTARLIDGEESARIGLIQRICADGNALDLADSLAADIISNDSDTHAAVKSCLSALKELHPFDQKAHDQDFEDAFIKPESLRRIEAFLRSRRKAD